MPVFRISTPVTPLVSAPNVGATCVSEALYGESVSLLEKHGRWMLVRQHLDQYEGFIHADALEAIDAASTSESINTHWVATRSTLLFKEPDLKSQVIHRIPFAAELNLSPVNGSQFSHTRCGYFVWSDHCLPEGTVHPMQPIALASSHFLGMPYRWGGRSPEGADCSGLIQLLARSQGISIPRDSGDQEAAIHEAVAIDQSQQADIVYWPGHTGILIDPKTVLHSTAHSLSCVIEPLESIEQRAGTPSSFRRLFQNH